MSRQFGVAVGIVKDLEDPEGQGRVKLQFPWLSETQRSSWAPIAAPLAGDQRGMWFMPEIDDEVLVAFEQGDFDHPFIVGYLWNGVDRNPDTDREHRVLVTPGGHEFRFEDNDGAKQVVLSTDGDQSITLSDTADGARVRIETSGGHRVDVSDTDSSITVATTGGLSLTLNDGAQSIELSGGGRSLTLQAGQVRIQ